MSKKIVAITSCVTGIAHTYMAAEAMKKYAAEKGYEIHVETQGATGVENALEPDDIASADAIVFAVDKAIDESRFAGRNVLEVTADAALKLPDTTIEDALAGKGVKRVESAADMSTDQPAPAAAANGAKGVFQHVMDGVSHMIPVVVAGGILTALSFCFGLDVANQNGTIGWALNAMGGIGLGLMIPVFSAFIASSVADRPGFVPGIIGGMIAANIGAGFIGGIVSGLLAGYITFYLNKWIKLPVTLNGLKPILILPILSTAAVGLIMYFVVGQPVAWLTAALNDLLTNSVNSAPLLLSLIFSLMYLDLGGAMSHVLYAFAVGLLGEGITAPMAAAMLVGMVPPIGLALATIVRGKLWSEDERAAGKACLLLGLSFITEGCIPFAASYPLEIILSTFVGNFVGASICLVSGVTLNAPHGGLFLLLIPGVINNPIAWVLSIAVGSIVSCVLIIVLMSIRRKREAKKSAA